MKKLALLLLISFFGLGIQAQTIANNDEFLVFMNCANHKLNVLKNDTKPEDCTKVEISTSPTYGSATTDEEGFVKYTAPTDFLGEDVFRYEITCNSITSIAEVKVKVVPKPDNIDDMISCYKEVDSSLWDIKRSFIPYPIISVETVVVGDIDETSDGEIEILARRSSGNMWLYVDSVIIFGGKSETVKYKFKTINSTLGTVCIGKPDKDSPVYVYMIGVDGFVYAYSHIGTFIWKSEVECSSNNLFSHSTMIADFGGDGKSEIFAGEKIFDAKTGALLLDCKLISRGYDFGASAGHPNTKTIVGWDSYLTKPAIADMDNDNLVDLIAGRYIYKIDLDRDNPVNSTCTVYKTANVPLARTEVQDGFTVVADIDLDGYLDVIVTTNNLAWNNAENKFKPAPADGDLVSRYLYAWSGRTGNLLNDNKIRKIQTNRDRFIMGPSMAFVGDLDGLPDKRPEIAFSYADGMAALKYNPISNTLDNLWGSDLVTEDPSASTTITMFDFNQDGKVELVYRDERNIRIINGIDGTDLGTFTCGSGTGNEYPVIADVKGLGSAQIIIGGNPVTPIAMECLNIFSHPTGAWAPARSVWNQFSYNSVNINDDLSIPKYQLNSSTRFPGVDGQLNTVDDKFPYNGFLMQQTVLSANGTAFFPTPEARLASIPTYVYNQDTDSLKITVEIFNNGDAVLAPVKITVYKDSVNSAVKHTYSYTETIDKKTSKTMTFGIPNFGTWIATGGLKPDTKMVIRINDKGDGKNNQDVCDDRYALSLPKKYSDFVKLFPDDTIVFPKDSVTVDILANDNIVVGSKLSIVSTSIGEATLVDSDSKIKFKANSCNWGGQTAIVKYDVCSGVGTDKYCDTSILRVSILNCPYLRLMDNCGFDPKMRLSIDYEGATYQWQYLKNGTWGNISYTGLDCTEIKPGKYRVNVEYGVFKYTTEDKELSIIEKKKVNNKIWYNLDFK